MDQFGRKRCQKKREDMDYKLLYEFFQKYFAVHDLWAVKNSVSTYVRMLCTGWFILNGIIHIPSTYFKFSFCFDSQQLAFGRYTFSYVFEILKNFLTLAVCSLLFSLLALFSVLPFLFPISGLDSTPPIVAAEL